MVASRVTKIPVLVLHDLEGTNRVTKIATLVLSGLEETTVPSRVTKIVNLVLSRQPPKVTQALITPSAPR